jgi:transposase
MLLECLEGTPLKQIAEKYDVLPNTVIALRTRFETKGLDALYDSPRSGRPPTYDAKFRRRVLATLEEDPPKGYAQWDGPLLARHLGVSQHAVWRLLRKEGISLARRRSWCVSTDPEFAAKAADVVGLYLNPPEKAVVLSVDEKPSIQARECPTGYVCTRSGKIVQGYKSTYKRHGTLNLFAALHVATGEVFGKVTERKRRPDFLEFMDDLLRDLPGDKEYHVILDNYCIHKKCDDWLRKHPNVHFHFTPTSASWLNMVEIWFCIFTRKALRHGTFSSRAKLHEAIESYIEAYNKNDAHPFVWRKREVKGSQLKDTIVNLCK